MQTLNSLSFFSGAMGMDIGLELVAFETRLACEVDKHCVETIKSNRPNLPIIGDLSSFLDVNDIRVAGGIAPAEEIDLVVGGPPCQSFSTAGKRKGLSDDRGNVFLHFIDIATKLEPKFIVIENVRGLLSCKDSNGKLAISAILEEIKKAGYSCSFNLYNSANFGVPQIRERVIMICSRNYSEIPFIEPTHSNDAKYGLPEWTTFREAINGLTSCSHVDFPEKRLQFYRKLSDGQNWKSLSIEDQKLAMGKSFYSGGGKTGFYRRLAWDKPSPTLVTSPTMPATDLCHPKEDRPLSVEEYKRIQQFPDDWKIAGPIEQQYKQVGNAVPIGVGFAIGRHITNLINGNPIREFDNFKYSRYKGCCHKSFA